MRGVYRCKPDVSVQPAPRAVGEDEEPGTSYSERDSLHFSCYTDSIKIARQFARALTDFLYYKQYPNNNTSDSIISKTIVNRIKF